MKIQKISVSIPQAFYEFIEGYREDSHKSRSEVIVQALKLLRQSQLEACYREANKEINAEFENTASDGLEDDETW